MNIKRYLYFKIAVTLVNEFRAEQRRLDIIQINKSGDC